MSARRARARVVRHAGALTAVAALVMLVLAPYADATRLGVVFKTRPYTITGSTVDDLRAQMQAHGPGTYFGEADWRTHWTYDYASGSGGCGITHLAVAITITYVLPSWTPPAGTDPAVIARYDRFYKRLTLHEHGHGAIAVHGTQAIRDQIQKTQRRPTCAAEGALANKIGTAANDAFDKAEAAYDTRTQHGATQGATF